MRSEFAIDSGCFLVDIVHRISHQNLQLRSISGCWSIGEAVGAADAVEEMVVLQREFAGVALLHHRNLGHACSLRNSR